jgi:hypothetical protein
MSAEYKKVKGTVVELNKGTKFNNLKIKTEFDEIMDVSDWNKLTLSESTVYLFEIKENNSYLNLQTAITEDGLEIYPNPSTELKSIKMLLLKIMKKLDN